MRYKDYDLYVISDLVSMLIFKDCEMRDVQDIEERYSKYTREYKSGIRELEEKYERNI